MDEALVGIKGAAESARWRALARGVSDRAAFCTMIATFLEALVQYARDGYGDARVIDKMREAVSESARKYLMSADFNAPFVWQDDALI
jgi:hypothetical protein